MSSNFESHRPSSRLRVYDDGEGDDSYETVRKPPPGSRISPYSQRTMRGYHDDDEFYELPVRRIRRRQPSEDIGPIDDYHQMPGRGYDLGYEMHPHEHWQYRQEGRQMLYRKPYHLADPYDWGYENFPRPRGRLSPYGTMQRYHPGYNATDDLHSVASRRSFARRRTGSAGKTDSVGSQSGSYTSGTSSRRSNAVQSTSVGSQQSNIFSGFAKAALEELRQDRSQELQAARLDGVRDEVKNDEELTIDQVPRSFSSESKMSNPQLLHAQEIPELPAGYLQRKDGVVISVASSVSSNNEMERYADVKDHPEEAAERVVENLRLRGFHIDDLNGIQESDSDSCNYSRYGGYPSESFSDDSEMETSRVAVTTASRAASIQSNNKNIFGILSPPGLSFRSKANNFSGTRKELSRRGKVNQSSVVDTATYTDGTRGSYTTGRSDSPGTTYGSQTISATKTSKSRNVESWTFPKRSELKSMLSDGTSTKAGKDRAKYNNFDAQHFRHGVNGVGAPSGIHVPHVVSNGKEEDVGSMVSGLTHQRSMGGTTVSSVTFQHPAHFSRHFDPIEAMLEKVLYSCRISACPKGRR